MENGKGGVQIDGNLLCEIRMRNLMLLTGKSREEIRSEAEKVEMTSPTASLTARLAVLAARKYGISREKIDAPSDKVMILRRVRKVSRKGSPYTIYDAVNFEGKLLRIFDYYDVADMKVGKLYTIFNFRFGEDMFTYRLRDWTEVSEAGASKLTSLVSFQDLTDINGVGFCKLMVSGVKEGLMKVCPECGRRTDGVCSSCGKKAVNKKWTMVSVIDGAGNEDKMFLKVDDSLAETPLAVGDWIYALIAKLPDRGKGESFNVIYFEKEGEERKVAKPSDEDAKGSTVMREIVVNRIMGILAAKPSSKEEVYGELKKGVPIGEKDFDSILSSLVEEGMVKEEDGLYWSSS